MLNQGIEPTGRLPFVAEPVLYILSAEDAMKAAMASGQADRVPEAHMRAGQALPGMVTKVWFAPPGAMPNVNVRVFPDGPGGAFAVLAIPFDSTRTRTGTWSFADE